jgi:hypothetical protein
MLCLVVTAWWAGVSAAVLVAVDKAIEFLLWVYTLAEGDLVLMP